MKLLRYVKILLLSVTVICLSVFVYSNYSAPYIVDGKSMEPTFNDGKRLEVNRFAYNLSEMDRFDIVVFHANSKEDYVKRIVGFPGETIEYRNDSLYINGEFVAEPFLEQLKKGQQTPYTEDFTLHEQIGIKRIPQDKIFVMGDNRPNSLDSRSFGCIDIDQVVGKVKERTN